MLSKQIRATQAHINKAVKLNKERGEIVSVCYFCVIFQALRAAKVPVVGVSVSMAKLTGGLIVNLDDKACKVTLTQAKDWYKLKPFKFTVTGPDTADMRRALKISE